MKALVTGISGFAGSHLAEYLLAHTDLELYGVTQSAQSSRGLQSVLAHPDATRVQLRHADLRDAARVEALVAEIRPDYIFHLAAQASVRTSWDAPEQTYAVNIFSQLNLLEAVRRAEIQPRILLVCTADVYGLILPDELPVDEDTPLRPASPYAVSKVTQDFMGYQYWAAHKLPVIRVRPFNHTGPRQSDIFASASFARQIAEIEHGLRQPVVRVGNLDALRDFTDVRDIVRGYWMVLQSGEAGQVYNMGSGVARSVREVLDTLLGFSRVSITIEVDPARMRPADQPELRCDSHRIEAATGWQPQVPFEKTIHDLLDDWRAVIRSDTNEAPAAG